MMKQRANVIDVQYTPWETDMSDDQDLMTRSLCWLRRSAGRATGMLIADRYSNMSGQQTISLLRCMAERTL